MLQASRSMFIAGALLAIGIPAHAASAESRERACDVADVEYDLSASLKITDTTMGAGDGVHRVGPGRVVLRFDDRPGHRRGTLLAYDVRQTFTVVSNVLFWSTSVTSDLHMRAAPTAPPVAGGTLDGLTLRWDGMASGVHSDGTLECSGSMCGKFGAPPSGRTEFHAGPTSIELKPFRFAAGRKTFTMPFAVVSESESPKERTLMSIAGREVRRACVVASTEK